MKSENTHISLGETDAEFALTIDARGEKCPLPVLRTEKAIAGMRGGERLLVLASDPVARIDIPFYCQSNGHYCTVLDDEAHLRFIITCTVKTQSEDGARPR